MLDVLLDGREHPAQALAGAAGIGPSTATVHLRRLEEGGVVASRRAGRQRLVRLAGPGVAAAYEALAELARERAVSGLGAWTRREELREVRTCYDHLAGRLGVAIADAALAAGAVEPDFSLAPSAASSWTRSRERGGRCSASARTGPSGASTSPARSAQPSAPRCSTPAGRSGARGRGRCA